MSSTTGKPLPHLLTIIGKGVPANYEITVDGEIDLIGANPLEEATVVTDHSVEGAVDTGVLRFRFSGQMANVHLVDWNGVPSPESPSTPDVHIEYDTPARNG